MPLSRIKSWIIGGLLGLALLALGGCSSLRLGYSNGPQLLWWWLDGYVDFSSAQVPQVKQGLERLFDWHRATQLPDYARLLAGAQAQVLADTTPALTCGWNARVRELLEPTLQRGLLLAAEQLPGLGAAQFSHLEQRYAKANQAMREDFMQSDPGDRLAASVKRARERAEQLYGRLDEAQIELVREGVTRSPFDPELWLKERQRRQREVLATLKRLAAEGADADRRLAALRMLVAHTERSPDPVYRAYQLVLTDYNCDFAARIHNATTPAQRLQARGTLQAWEQDFRALAAVP